jgi:hypothetical protein
VEFEDAALTAACLPTVFTFSPHSCRRLDLDSIHTKEPTTMFRFLLVPLAVIGIIAIFTGGVTAATALGVGAGFLALKVLLVIMFFGMIGGFFRSGRHWRGGPSFRPPRSPWSRRADTAEPSREEQFEEWHRMAHAREEVDSWVDDGE